MKHGEDALDPVNAARRTKQAMAILELPRTTPLMLPGHGWRPPEQGVIKISTDGALNFADDQGGGGGIGIARSDTALLAAWCKSYPDISDPFVMEASFI